MWGQEVLWEQDALWELACKRTVCSGSINPDTNLGGNLATVNEVFNDQQTSIIYDRV